MIAITNGNISVRVEPHTWETIQSTQEGKTGYATTYVFNGGIRGSKEYMVCQSHSIFSGRTGGFWREVLRSL